MKRSFVVTAVTTTVAVDSRGHGRLTVVVANTRERSLPARATVIAENPASAPWLALDEEPGFTLPSLGSRTLTLIATVPPDAPMGLYRAQVAVWAESAPDEDYVTGPTLAIEVPARPAPAPWRFPWVAVLLVLMTIIGLAAPWIWGTSATHGWQRQVHVPNLVGLPSPQAAELLAPVLSFGVVSQAPSGNRPVGCLLAQDPLPGTLVAVGSTVAVTVHGGILVPRFTGKTLSAATQIATANQIYVAPPTISVEPSDQPLDTILRQHPDPDTPVAAGSTVTVVLLGGVALPKLTGASLDFARTASATAGLTLVVAANGPSGPLYQDGLEKPLVLSQNPAPGTILTSGGVVTITLAYPTMVTVTP